GFSSAKPWFALNPNYKSINVEDSLADKNSVFYYYQKLIKLRHNNEIIKYGSFEEIDPDDDQVYAYRRHYEGKTLLLISNFTDKIVSRDYGQSNASSLLIDNYEDDKVNELRPYEAKAYLFK
ncbi:alpha-glucosidase C-terminal domain-containing protein, partial [Oenococcus oeni]